MKKQSARPGLYNPALATIHDGDGRLRLVDGRFLDPRRPRLRSSGMFWRWKISGNPQRRIKRRESYRLNVVRDGRFLDADGDFIVWLGHASFFIRIGGLTLLTDPVFYHLPFIRRRAPLPVARKRFRGIDYILLSHGHRDHMDQRTLKLLAKLNPGVVVLAPMGAGALLQRLDVNYQEAGWYQHYRTNGVIDFFFLPAKHWHRRGVRDLNRMLWGSFVIRSGDQTLYFAGDTAFDDHFDEVARLFPDIDVAIMPIGAYKPEFMMRRSHMSPPEAIEGFNRLGARRFVPMHYGTFDLTDEPLGEPVSLLRQYAGRLKGELSIIDPGEILKL